MAKSRNPTRGFQYLRGNWVYYQRLRTDGYYPKLAEMVNVRQFLRVQRMSKFSLIAEFFYQASQAELAKEMDLLISKFGSSISGSYENENFAKELITALNTCLGIKKVFERNLALIKESKGQKNVMSFFPTYFEKVWERRAPQIFEDAAQKFVDIGTIVPGDALADAVDKQLPELIREAVLDMFNAKVESGIKQNRDDYATAYAEMAEAVRNNTGGSNEFIQSFIRNYRLDRFIETIRKSMDEMPNFTNALKGKFNIKSQMAQRGGLTMEDFRTFAFNLVGESLANVKGTDSMRVSVNGISTGSTKMKPDSIGVVDIPLDIVSDWVQNNSFGTRVKDTQAILKLQESLQKFDGGFITYVNAKNYSLNNNFENGRIMANGDVQLPGFSAGSMISLQNFQDAANNLEINYDKLVSLCLQLIPGAIGADDGTIESTKIALTQAIASALFDDFNMVGTVEASGAKSIHLLDLNGVLTPISFYFHLLGQAFAEVGSFKPEDLVTVQIETPGSILYPEKFPEERKGGGYARWQEQSEAGMSQIKIGYHFLSAFRSVMKQFM